jgi:hypothetical protein
MDDDLRAELVRLAVKFTGWGSPSGIAAAKELRLVLARHSEPAALSEPDLDRAQRILYPGVDWINLSHTMQQYCRSLAAEFAQVRAEHAKQVAPSEREKRLEKALTAIRNMDCSQDRDGRISQAWEIARAVLSGEQAKEAKRT